MANQLTQEGKVGSVLVENAALGTVLTAIESLERADADRRSARPLV
jgi:hypothetical protein